MHARNIGVPAAVLATGALIFGLSIVVRGAPATTRTLGSSFLPQYTRPTDIPFPKDNAYTPARERLGRLLFFDPRLSGSNWISCASCHNPGFSWGDGLPRALGHGMQTLARRTPTILNLAWADAVFWDGRADTLEQQALGPISAPGEMNQPAGDLGKKLASIEGYRTLFAEAYPGEPLAPPTVAKAIATFERGIVSVKSPFDRWVASDDRAISEDAARGFVVFNAKAGCAKCHSGWRFTDDGFHDIGLPGVDVGRGALLKDIPSMQHAFKTPTLRDVDRRAPYMHDGSLATLEDVIDFYDRGGAAARESLSPDVKRLGLTGDEKQQLIAFLHTLTSPPESIAVPALPR
jgi:cytochrome c peroxidase